MKPTKTILLLDNLLPQDLPPLPSPALNPNDQAPVVTTPTDQTELEDIALESSARTDPGYSAPVSSALPESDNQALPDSAPPEPNDPAPVPSVQPEPGDQTSQPSAGVDLNNQALVSANQPELADSEQGTEPETSALVP